MVLPHAKVVCVADPFLFPFLFCFPSLTVQSNDRIPFVCFLADMFCLSAPDSVVSPPPFCTHLHHFIFVVYLLLAFAAYNSLSVPDCSLFFHLVSVSSLF